MRPRVRIATVYQRDSFPRLAPTKMSTIRWLRISESLAMRGYHVDMIVDGPHSARPKNPNLRFVPFSEVDWSGYDVVKTLFHSGFDTLWEEGGRDHPFIISKLGSVVGDDDGTGGVYFFHGERERLYAIQRRIHRTSRFVTLLTTPSRKLWEAQFGESGNLLLVPTGVDREVPEPRRNPYKGFHERIVVYIGNIYGEMQRETNELWQARLNALGRRLLRRGIRLCFLGTGRVDRLDTQAVTVLGTVHNSEIWDYQHFADVGLVLAQGQPQHNESSKIYYYLRTGLPVVSEAPVPNNFLIEATGMGYVADYGDERMIVDMIERALHRKWPRTDGIRYIVENHTWDQRVDTYDAVIRRELGLETA
jgi:hypothetical protein